MSKSLMYNLKPEEYDRLDALVAEHIYGYKWFYHPSRKNNLRFMIKPESLMWAHSREQCTPAQIAKMKPYIDWRGTVREEVPRYSKDPHAAIDLFLHMCKDGRWCCLNIKADYHYSFDVFITYAAHNDITKNMSNKQVKKLLNKHEVTTKASAPDELPLAIVRAALHAYGVDHGTK